MEVADLLPRPPRTHDREGRVSLLVEAADAMLAGKRPSRETELFLGSALSAWLTDHGSLTRDYLRVDGIPGSHRTAAHIAQNIRSSRGQQEIRGDDTLPAEHRFHEEA